MLDMTLGTSFVPGTNVKGKLAGNWTYLLPSLELGRMLCLGVPSEAALETFGRVSEQILVLSNQPKALATLQSAGVPRVQGLVFNGRLPLPEHSLDLLFVGSEFDTSKLPHNSTLLAELKRVLRPEGLVYFEHGGPATRGQLSEAAQSFAQQLGRLNLFWITPMMGEMETAVPANDQQITHYFINKGLYSPAIVLSKRIPFIESTLEKTEKLVWQNKKLRQYANRYGVLVGPANADLAVPPPRYLRHALDKVGLDGGSFRWGLIARGLYRSRKVIFFLFDQQANTPKIVVKMTRGSEFNYRLENEFLGLTVLKEKGVGDAEVLPQPVFLEHHGGLVLMGQTVIEGTPFQKQTNKTADCPYANIALNWLIDLSVKTADPLAATPQQVARGLNDLYMQFASIYKLSHEERTFLERQLLTLQTGNVPLPTVFQHGDPGTWNVLITQTGRPAFLDWEASEPKGMPLWDLIYFLRSYCVGAARAQGVMDGLAGFEQQFLQTSPLSDLVIKTFERYCEAIDLPRIYWEPLFYTCWMHRALKEATRLTGSKLEKAQYLNLLRLCIAQRQSPTLTRLFG